MENFYDIIIAGGGPAGLSAAIYASRMGAKVAVIEGMAVGGQAALTPKVENYPARENASGFEITYDMQKQAESFGTVFVYGSIEKVSLKDDVKAVFLKDGSLLKCKAFIICTGAISRKLDVKGEAEFTGRGVSYCATCDANFFKEKTVIVAGGGNTALTDALVLASLSQKVYIVYRGDKLRATPVLIQKAQENPRIEIMYRTKIVELKGDEKLRSAILDVNGVSKEMPCDGIFVAIGYIPNSEVFKYEIITDDSGYIIVDKNALTNVKGVYAAGDVTDGTLKQIVTAAAGGALAGENAGKFVMEINK